MNFFKRNVTTALVAMMLMAGSALSAQTVEEAAAMFQEANTLLAENDYDAALRGFGECIDFCEEIGEEADEIRNAAIEIMPQLKYNYAIMLSRENKYDEAVRMYEQAIRDAKKYNRIDYVVKAEDALSKLHYKAGTDLIKASEFPKGIEAMEKAVAIDSTNSAAYYYMGYAYAKLGQSDKRIAVYREGIEKGSNESLNIKMQESLNKIYSNKAVQLINTKLYPEAFAYLDTALGIMETVEAYYYYGVGLIGAKRYDAAQEKLEKAMALTDDKDPGMTALINYELGQVFLYGKDDKKAACNYFSMAKADTAASDKAQKMLSQLKCE